MRRLLKRVARIGGVYPVAHDHYFTHDAVAALSRIVRDLAAEHAFASAARFRDRIGTAASSRSGSSSFSIAPASHGASGTVMSCTSWAMFVQEQVDGSGR